MKIFFENCSFRRIFFGLLLGLLLTAFLFSFVYEAKADTGSSGFAITNATFPVSQNITAFGATDVDLRNQDNCTIIFQGGMIFTNAGNVLAVVSPKDSTGVVVSNVTWTLTFPAQSISTPGSPTTNYVRIGTNLTREVIGAYTGLQLRSATNQSLAGAVQNPSLLADLKTVNVK